MPRFILRRSGGAETPEESLGLALGSANVKIVDRSPQMMLIEGSEEDARQLASQISGWTLHPEVQYRLPDARKVVTDE